MYVNSNFFNLNRAPHPVKLLNAILKPKLFQNIMNNIKYDNLHLKNWKKFYCKKYYFSQVKEPGIWI